ncbi:MAG: NUDIX hydrolase [Dermatophilaceae bacterium]
MRTAVNLIDIFNDRYELVGTEEKNTAHATGLWHRTFSALAINPTTQRVVLQKKAPGRYSFDRPDYADITVGGHYQAGETIPDGVREVHEELGLPVAYSDLHPIGLRQTAVTLAPDYIEREFQHWHLIPLDVALEDIPLADAEVSGLVDIALTDAIALADGDTNAVRARYATRADNGVEYCEATLTTSDLIPNYLRLDQLYLRLFVAARRFCAGDRRHVFW